MTKKNHAAAPRSLPGLTVVPPPTARSQEIVDITPEMAIRFLESNEDNRKVVDARYKAYAAVMRAGGWKVNNQGIGFDTNGRLIDGQHRLWAIIEAGVTVSMLVVRGLDPEAAKTTDRGANRSIAEVLRREGRVPHPKLVASWSNVVTAIASKSAGVGSVEAVEAFYDSRREAIDWALGLVPSKSRFRLAPIWGAFIFAYQRDPARVREFAERFLAGDGLTKGSPILLLREFASETSTSGSAASRDLALRVLRAVEAFIRGESLRALYATESAVGFFSRAQRDKP